jgi:YidC/Oxa1 family membrane protein insertase
MFETFLIKPLYNGFIFLVGIAPGGDVGFAIIILTLLIRAVFYPAFTASIRTQMGMQAAQGEIDEINRAYKDNKEERAKKTLELYKKKKIRPFASLLVLIIQLPVFIALYFAFFREGLPNVAQHLLYSFVPAPDVINTNFLGILDLLKPHNIALAVVVGALQYLFAYLTMARTKKNTDAMTREQQTAHKMQQGMMLYMFPVMMAAFAYSLPGAVGLYFAATNVISIGQEWLIRHRLSKKAIS